MGPGARCPGARCLRVCRGVPSRAVWPAIPRRAARKPALLRAAAKPRNVEARCFLTRFKPLICTKEKTMNRSDLMLHCGAHAVDREQVYRVPTPAGTRTWFPIAHGKVLDEVQQVLTNNGLHVVSEAHGLTRDG